MRVAVTGTPGTGKTTAVERVETDLEVVHLNDLIKREGLSLGRDDERDTLVADPEAVRAALDGRDDILVESHLAHSLDADRVVVLRAHPETILDRLAERGESEATRQENAESEAFDVVLSGAVDHHGEDSVYEIDTTERSPDEVATEIEAVIAGDADPSAGTVDYLDWIAS